MWRRKQSAVLVALAVLVVPAPAYAQEGLDSAAVERVVDGFAARAGYPGVAVAITKGDQVLHMAGYGHDSGGAEVSAATPMPIASVSKSFTALAVMQLVDAGKVTLDAPVRDYLPGFRIDDSRGDQITVRQLLNQTSGITDRTLREKSLPQPDSLAAAVERARDATPAGAPGTRHAYTNTNYHLAARVVEVVSGEPFGGYLQRHVFGPAGMPDTIAIARTPHDLPRGHTYAYGASIAAAEPDRFVDGSDGVITTARDMARWLVVQNTGGLVSKQSMTAMHTASDPRWTYGMGWDTSGGRLHHNGIWFTATASALLLPSGHGIAVLGNSGFSLATGGTDALADALASLIETGRPPAPPAPTRLIVDLVLAALTVLSVLLGVRRLRRGGPLGMAAVRLLPRAVPLVLLVSLPYLLGTIVGNGRDITFRQLTYTVPALVVWVAVAALLNVGTIVARVAARLRGGGLVSDDAPRPETREAQAQRQ
ncbi:serine hydrolase domain-containing protein [Paractinoplanes lichenicola]|uniref:Beta-lactamase family protein n=1 Tax=Paractinoplanes lichenicola TaxID=2802976 RepID=A0ABS1VP10_9ACTN|nr:serine hydrolase domain-containing protein [Actinoplanes lichenicola]MBL7255869.1 beta-lactamase family protein [Actinoplanes lichenicola]